MRANHCLVRIVLCVVISLVAGRAAAQPVEGERDAARTLFFEAHKALKAGEFERAAELFEKADAVYHAPTTLLGLARARVGLGKLALAHETYERILADGVPPSAPPPFIRALADAKDEIAALEPRLATIVVELSVPAQSVVTIDGRRIAREALGRPHYVDPGDHEVVATARGFLDARATVKLAAGESTRVALTLRPMPKEQRAAAARRPAQVTEPADRSTEQAVGVTLTVLGLAAVVAAAVTGGLYLQKKGVAEEHCTADRRCVPEGLDAASAAKTLGIVNTVAWPVGAVALGVGTYFLVTGFSPDEPKASGMSLVVGGAF
jgi:hypothetical protein